MTVRLALGAGLLAALLTLPSCDGGDAPDAPGDADARGSAPTDTRARPGADGRSAPAASACSLADERRLERALGFDVAMNDNTTGSCVVTPADGSPGRPALDFRIEERTTAYDYFSAQADATPIEGLGERAVWATVNELTGNLVVVTGGRAIVVAIAEADGLTADSRRSAEAVARLLLPAQ